MIEKIRLSLALLLLASASNAAVIIHSPVLNASLGQSIEIGATLSGVKSPSSARLYFRAKGRELYQSLEMAGSAFQVSGRIPGETVGASGVEYYLEVVDAQGRVTDPAANPQVNPHFVSVRQGQKAPGLTILSPLQDDLVETTQPVITVAFDNSGAEVDPKDVELLIDGTPIPDRRNMQVFSTLLSYIPSGELSQGRHTVKAVVHAGEGAQAEWSFTVNSKTTVKLERNAWLFNGDFKAQTQYAATAREPKAELQRPSMPYQPYGTNRGNLDLILRGPGQTYRLDAYVTDEDRAEQQPTNRYTASVATEDLILTLGDSSPSFSVLSLNNLYRLRGVSLDLRSGSLYEAHSRTMAVWGQTRRGVDNGAGTPTYAQYLYGARYEWGMTDWLQWGLNSVSVSDDTSGVANKGGVNPTSNSLATSDLKIQIKPLYLTLQGEGGESIYAGDSSLTGMSAGTAYLAGAHVNVLPSATRLDFEWRDLGGNFGSMLGVNAAAIPLGYSSAANPGLLPDYRGFESSFSQGLWENQISCNVFYNSWRDNLAGLKLFATRTDYVYGSLNLAPANLPYLSLGYGSQTQKNGANGPVTQTAYVDTLTGNINASLGYTAQLGTDKSLNGTLSYVQSNYMDMAPAPKTSQDTVSRTYVVSLLAVLANTTLNGAYSLGGSEYSSLGGVVPAYSASNTTLNLRAARAWVPRVFNSYFNFDLNGTKSDDLARTETSRSTYTLGSQVTLAEAHRFELSASLVQVGLRYRDVGLDSGGNLVIGDTLENPYGQFLAMASYQFTF